MFDVLTWVAVVGAILAHTGAAVLFKMAAQRERWNALLFFTLGNGVGFFNPLCVTIAMRDNSPNLIYAVMNGVGGVFFVLVLNWVFKGVLSPSQWIGVFIIVLGTLLLQLYAENAGG